MNSFLPDFQPGPFALTRHRDGMPQYSRVAGGDILPSRFVALASAVGRVRQATTGDKLYGISQAEKRGEPYTPSIAALQTLAAMDGEDVFIFGPYAWDVPLVYGGRVAIGDRLTTDNAGRGVKPSAGAFVLAVAQEAGNVGELHLVSLITPQRMH